MKLSVYILTGWYLLLPAKGGEVQAPCNGIECSKQTSGVNLLQIKKKKVMMDDEATYTFGEEEVDETEMTKEKNQWPPVGHSVSLLESDKSMLSESGRNDNTWGGRRRAPRRRSKKMEKTTFYRITRKYGTEHYDRCRGHLHKDHGYDNRGGWKYAKIVLFEDHDCKGKSHTEEIKGLFAPGENRPDHHPDMILKQANSHGKNKISSIGISLNSDLLFDGLSEEGEKDGTPWFNGKPATRNRRSPRAGKPTPYLYHEKQIFCLDLYEYPDFNSFNETCNELKKTGASSDCKKYDKDGEHFQTCCSIPGNFPGYTGFCAYNVPQHIDDSMMSWVFKREHRRRNYASGSCMTQTIENTEKSLKQCLQDVGSQLLWDLVPWPGPMSIGDLRSVSGAANNCKETCAIGGKILLKCAEGMLWVAVGKASGELGKAAMQKGLTRVFQNTMGKSVAGHVTAAALGGAVSTTQCFLKEIQSGAAACLAPSTVFRVPGQKNGVPLRSIDIESAITVVNVESIGEEEAVGQSKVASGTVLGFAKKNDNYTRQYIELNTTSGKSVRCTPEHFLWVKEADGISKLLLAKNVRKGHNLPVVGALSSVVEWEVIENITEAIMEAGAVMPIARTSDWETADMVVTEAGIVVPVYAGGTEYSALTPSDAHNLFKAWLHHWSKLHAELPCLMNISHGTHGSMLLEVLQEYGQHHHAGKLGKVEMTPPEFLCYVYVHIDEFRDTVKKADLELAQDCEGITEMIQACDENMRRRMEKDVIADDDQVPDPISPVNGQAITDADM